MEVDLETCKNVSINWEVEIEQASGGTFSMSGLHNLVMKYSQQDEYCFHTKSKIVKIDDGEINEIFETVNFLAIPSVDKNGNLYVCSHSYSRPDRNDDKSTLLMINPEGKVVWEYLLDASCAIKPFIYQDTVLVYDFNGPEQYGNLYRINKNGTLMWKKSFDGNALSEPIILKSGGQDSIFLHAFEKFFILDMNGDILKNKKIGRPYVNGLYANEGGDIYACINPNLLYLNMNLDIIWAYKPDIGFVTYPSKDSLGNLYCMLTGSRMVSLDSQGKERWIAEVTGDFGYRPMILANGDILVITTQKSGKKAPQIENNTYLETFSPDGTKLLKYELPGYVINTTQDTDGTIFLNTGCRRVFPRKHQVRNSIKVFSISIG
jgi:hypothetical protein